jgi:hypothetical protein
MEEHSDYDTWSAQSGLLLPLIRMAVNRLSSLIGLHPEFCILASRKADSRCYFEELYFGPYDWSCWCRVWLFSVICSRPAKCAYISSSVA